VQGTYYTGNSKHAIVLVPLPDLPNWYGNEATAHKPNIVLRRQAVWLEGEVLVHTVYTLYIAVKND